MLMDQELVKELNWCQIEIFGTNEDITKFCLNKSSLNYVTVAQPIRIFLWLQPYQIEFIL